MTRRIMLPVLALVVSAVAAVAPASAGVLAFRTSDGSADPAFVKLGRFTTVRTVVPDRAGGVYLIGSISVNGGQRKMVHINADGSVDPRFRPVIRGGRIVAAAVQGSRIAVVGSFTGIGGQRRAGVAVLDAASGRALAWRPVVPRPPRTTGWGDVAFAGSTLVVSTWQGVYGWRAGARNPAWWAALDLSEGYPARLVAWRGTVMVLHYDPARVERLAKLAPEDGRWRDRGIDMGYASSLQNIGGRLLALVQGAVVAVDDSVTSRTLASCDETQSPLSAVIGVAGDARTLYAARFTFDNRHSGVAPGLTACPFDGGTTAFTPPLVAYGFREPSVHAVALIGSHALVFTQLP